MGDLSLMKREEILPGLLLMRDNISLINGYGLCKLIYNLRMANKISIKMADNLEHYIMDHRPKWYSPLACWKANYGFFWPMGEKWRRYLWIQWQIFKIKYL